MLFVHNPTYWLLLALHAVISCQPSSLNMAKLYDCHSLNSFLDMMRVGVITDLYYGLCILRSQCSPLLTIKQLSKVISLTQFCSAAQYDIFLQSCISVLTVVSGTGI